MQILELQSKNRLAENIVYFGRALRRAGLPITSEQMADAQRAVLLAGLESREDLRNTLSALMVKKHEHAVLFNQAFELYWQNPRIAERMIRLMLPTITGRTPQNQAPQKDLFARVAGALHTPKKKLAEPRPDEPDQIKLDASMTFSTREALKHKDFETMSLAEMHEARRQLARLEIPLPRRKVRRLQADARGRHLDRRATFRDAVRRDLTALSWARQRTRPLKLVVLADISGSMDRYVRMLLFLFHHLASQNRAVETFLFGTRLTRITRQLKHRDVDVAIDDVSHAVQDWAGGTRLTSCIETFNRRYARRVLSQGALVLLITDGLDAEVAEPGRIDALKKAAQQLKLSCRRLVWLNPLLRFDAFEAKPLGVQAILPYVDAFLPVHNLDSLAQLAGRLATLAHAPRPERGDYSVQTHLKTRNPIQ
jgi:uncharacterized protein